MPFPEEHLEIVDEDPSDDEVHLARARALVGTTLQGKYRLDRVLGAGGMACVFAATHRNQAEFAVKMLHPELCIYPEVRSRFLREGYAANSVKHPGVVLVVDDDVGEGGAAFLVMELLHGSDVESTWERHGFRLAPRVALAIADQLLDVLAAAHEKGVVHRDIKPANLFLQPDGTVKVLDFGIARARDSLSKTRSQTRSGLLLGTPAFMAPEQALAMHERIDGQSDLWAVGATIFALLSGEFVHEGENTAQLLAHASTKHARSLRTVMPTLAEPVTRVVDRALSFEMADRWKSARAMQSALREAYLDTFGTEISRSVLASLATAMSPTMPPPTGEVTSSASHAGPARSLMETTHKPVLQGDAFGRSEGASARGRWAVGALAVLGIAAALSLVARAPAPPRASGLVAEATNASAAAADGRSTAPAEPTPPAAAPPASATPTPPAAAPPASATASAKSRAAPLPINVPKGPASAATATAAPRPHAAAPSCDPPFFFDAQNRKIFKPECL